MKFSVKVFYSPAYELLVSFCLYIRASQHKYLSIGSNWKERVSEQLDPVFKEQMDNYQDLTFEDLSVLFIEQHPDFTIYEYFEWMENLTAGEMFEMVSPYIENKEQLPLDLNERRNQYITMLKKWNEQYFSNIDQGILKFLQQDVMEKETSLMVAEDKLKLVEDISRGFYISSEKYTEVVLIPSHHVHPIAFSDRFKNKLIITYPVNKGNTQIDNILLVTKALGDKKRLEIIDFLKTGVYSFTDIYKEIKMAKGNIHHHLMVLRGAGVLRIYIKEDSKNFYFSVRKYFIEELKFQLQDLIH